LIAGGGTQIDRMIETVMRRGQHAILWAATFGGAL
jgi:hypothetical protein